MDGEIIEMAVIGAGNMAEAIVRGILSAGLYRGEQMVAADPAATRRDLFTRELGIRTTETPASATANARIVLLSVKPQQMEMALQSVNAPSTSEPSAGGKSSGGSSAGGQLVEGQVPGQSPGGGSGTVQSAERRSGVHRGDPLFISIAAGVPTKKIEAVLGGRTRVVRAMPNTPMLIGQGMTAICRGAHASMEDLRLARQLFECAGRVINVEESQMEAVTAVSGSGPAYVFYLAEQMIAAGQTLGLSADQASMLTLQTIAGAGAMLGHSSDSPAELRRKVTSPGGTTQAAIETLDALHMPDAVRRAVIAAAERGTEMGKG